MPISTRKRSTAQDPAHAEATSQSRAKVAENTAARTRADLPPHDSNTGEILDDAARKGITDAANAAVQAVNADLFDGKARLPLPTRLPLPEGTIQSAADIETRDQAALAAPRAPIEKETVQQRKARESLEIAGGKKPRRSGAKTRSKKAPAQSEDPTSPAPPARTKPTRAKGVAVEAAAPSGPSVEDVAALANATGEEIIDAMVKEVSLDQYFDTDPKKLTDADFEQIILTMRSARHRFTKAAEDKKAKARGELTDEE